jgi:hypothetical protein
MVQQKKTFGDWALVIVYRVIGFQSCYTVLLAEPRPSNLITNNYLCVIILL